MIISTKNILLYIEPKSAPSAIPMTDELTLKLSYQMMNSKQTGVVNAKGTFIPGIKTMGVHKCTSKTCNNESLSYDILLPCGLATNTLALHYLMYHRNEVSPGDLKKISEMYCEPGWTVDLFDENLL
jgi:hypothetical protein